MISKEPSVELKLIPPPTPVIVTLAGPLIVKEPAPEAKLINPPIEVELLDTMFKEPALKVIVPNAVVVNIPFALLR